VPARPKDRTVSYLMLAAVGLSLTATAYFYHHGQLVLYDDEFSRMTIARRTFDNPVGFSLAQLGGVWLPWPQLLMMPFLAVNALYFDGIGGSIPSMLSYVASAVLIYKIVYHLTGARRAPAIAGAAVFVLSPNVLYMQSTALSELCMFVSLLAGIYGVQRFFEVERRSSQRRYLAFAGVSCALALLTRYEGWIVTSALLGCLVCGCIRRGDTRSEVKAYALAFAFLPALALAGWLAYNQVIFGSALYFYDGPYAKPSLWSSAADPAVGHWLVSAATYLYAILDDTNWPTVVLALAGVIALAWRRRLAAQTLPALSLLTLIPFFVWSLHGAQRPMHVPQINHSLYNTRFALVFVPAAAIYIGCLIGMLRSTFLVRAASIVAVGAAVGAMVLCFEAPDRRITTLQDNLAWSRQPVAVQFASAAAYLRANYRGGLVLAQFFGNEGVLYEAHITPAADVYEGIHQLWRPALANPVGTHIQWILIRTNPIDRVYRSLHGSDRLRAGYRLVYDQREYQIYRRRRV
jgi:Dolichyl-phosphate-mannose-protein mannosyltransferase